VSTLQLILQPLALAALYVWSFAVLSAAQLTIRLIMAFSVRLTLFAALLLSVAALVVAAVWDVVLGPNPSLSTRVELALVPMVLMAMAGFAIARWVLRMRRLRGQVIGGLMIGLLDPHLFTILPR
jgi:hypothetical protein